MKILDRYIIRAFLVNYAISLAVLMSLFVAVDLMVNVDEFTRSSDTKLGVLRNICAWYGNNVFLYFSLLSGAITLVAAAFTLGRMVRDNELTAMLSAGTSLYRVAAPVIIVGILMNVLWVADQEIIIPRIGHKLSRPRQDAGGASSIGVWFLPDQGGALVSAGKFHPQSGQMRRVFILEREPDGQAKRFIAADGGRWDAENHQWLLSRGFAHEWPSSEAIAAGLGMESLRSDIAAYPSNLTPEDIMVRQGGSQWTSFLSVRQMNQLEEAGMSNPRIIKRKHGRMTQPLINMILLLVGVPFFLTREPRPPLASGALCVAVGGGFFVFSFVCQNMIDSGSYPALPAWLPVLVFGPIVTLMLDSVKT